MEAQLSHQSINLHLGNPGLMLLSQDEILNTREFSEIFFNEKIFMYIVENSFD